MLLAQIITITDGEPTAESDGKVFKVIKNAKDACSKSHFGAGAVAFQFAQVRSTSAQWARGQG